MITVIREKLQGNGFRFVLALMILLMGGIWILSPILDSSSPGRKEDWALKVNNDIVSMSHFNNQCSQLEHQFSMIKKHSAEYFDYIVQTHGTPQKVTIDDFVTKKILSQIAQNIPVSMHPDYIVDKLKNRQFIQQAGISSILPPHLIDEKGNIDGLQLKYYLKKTGMTIIKFEELLEEAFEQNFVEQLIAASTFVPRSLIHANIEKMYASKQFAILHWPIKNIFENEKKADVSAEELRAFYDDQNKQYKRYWKPEKRSGSMWYFPAETYGVNVSEESIASYYKKNRKSYVLRQPTVTIRRIFIKVEGLDAEAAKYGVAQDILKKVQSSPDSFAELAQQYSEDSLSAQNGGLMQPFSKGEVEKSIEDVAFSLKTNGESSNVFKSESGFEIIQLVQKAPIKYKELSDVQSDIKHMLIKEVARKSFLKDVKSFPSKPSKDYLIEFARNHGSSDPESIGLTENTNALKVKTLFGIPVPGEFLYEFDGNGVYLILLDSVQDSYELELEDVHGKVLDDLYQLKARNSLQSLVQQAKLMMPSSNVEEVARKLNTRVIYTESLYPFEKQLPESIRNMGIVLADLFDLEKVSFVKECNTEEGGSLIQLVKKEQLSSDIYQKHEDQARKELFKGNITENLGSVIASFRKGATIKISDSIIQ